MKICIINNLYPPYARGGAEQVVSKTVQGLLAKGHEIVLITTCPSGKYVEKEGNLTIYRFKPKNLFFYTDAHKYNWFSRLLWHVLDIFHFSSAEYVEEILRKEKPDIVHTHNLMGIGFLIPNIIRKLKLRHFHTVHDVQLVEPSGIILKEKENSFRYTGIHIKFYSWIMKKLCGSPDVVISPSQFLLQFYEKRKFFPKSKRIVLRNPVTFDFSIKKERENNNDIIKFLYLGQIENHKGILILIEAFKELLKDGRKAELHIAGDGALLDDVKSITSGIKNIKIYGKVNREELPDLFSKTDVTVVPSLCYENSPTVIFESLYFGVPVLASNIEGIAELIEEGKNGLTFKAVDKSSLIEKMVWCIENSEKLKEMSKKTDLASLGLGGEGEYIEKLEEFYKK
jgi:glycosyltransferase involved in cell wall biosynthesis